jgi:type III secretion system FlhB-like substrate exporter
MFKAKSIAASLLVLAVLFAQVGTAFAAPVAQETTSITGTIVALDKETDVNGVTTAVLVTVLSDTGTTQTYRISVEAAVQLQLASVDEATQVVTLDTTKVKQLIEIPTTMIMDEETPEEAFNPVAAILASFFGVDASVINQYHEDGYGFGVIAQALWIAKGLNNDVTTAGLILQAKQTGDYSAFVLPDGSTPTNWGQFKKAALGKDKKNLGIIMSGHAEIGDDDILNSQQHGKGNGKDKNKDKGNGHGNGNNRP